MQPPGCVNLHLGAGKPGQIGAGNHALLRKRLTCLRVAVVDDTFMARTHQAAHYVGAHAPESGHPDLHSTAPLVPRARHQRQTIQDFAVIRPIVGIFHPYRFVQTAESLLCTHGFGNGRFVYFPAIPEFITGKKTARDITIDIRPWLWRRNIRFVDAMVTDVQDGGRTVVTTKSRQMYECATLLDYALKKKGVRERFEIHLFSPDIEPGETGLITDSLLERGIVLDYGYAPVEFIEGGMIDPDGSFRKADLVLFTPGITAPGLPAPIASNCPAS